MGNMRPIDSAVVKNETYDVLSADTMGGEYIETIGAACQNPDGYTSGSLFLGKDNDVQHLYRATAAIAFGETIILDTNCVYTTVSGELEGKAEESEVTSLNEALSNEVVTRSANGAHNLLPNTASNKVDNGVSFTVNDNGSVTVSGTPGASPGYGLLTLSDNYTTELAGKTVICGGGNNVTDKCYINIECYNSSATRILDKNITTSEETFTIPEGTARIRCFLMVLTGFSGTSTLIYPMIRLASDADPTYQPYAKTNKELTEDGYIRAGDVIHFDITDIFVGYSYSSNEQIRVYIPLNKKIVATNVVFQKISDGKFFSSDGARYFASVDSYFITEHGVIIYMKPNSNVTTYNSFVFRGEFTLTFS